MLTVLPTSGMQVKIFSEDLYSFQRIWQRVVTDQTKLTSFVLKLSLQGVGDEEGSRWAVLLGEG